MAIVSLGELTLSSNGNKTAAATLAVTSTATPAVGDLVTVECGRDDVANDTVPDTLTDTHGNTWNKVSATRLVTVGTALDGTVAVLFWSKITTAWTGTTTLTWSWTGNSTAKVIRAYRYSGVDTVDGAHGTGDAASTAVAVSVTPSSGGCLVIAHASRERPFGDTATDDADTVNGTWSATSRSGVTTGGSAVSNTSTLRSEKIVTASGAQTFNSTIGTSGDWAALAISFTAGPLLVGVGSAASAGSGVLTGLLSKPVELALKPSLDPVNSYHTMSVRARGDGAGGTMRVRLLQGATQRASWTETVTTSWTTFAHQITTGEADAITDYTALRVEISQDTPSTTAWLQVSWIEFELDSLPAGGPSGAGTIVFTGTGTGTPVHFGEGAGTLVFTGDVTGTLTKLGSGAGTVTFAGEGTGAVTRYGEAAGTFTFAGTGTGARTAVGAAAGTVEFTGTGTGTVVRFASGSGTVTFAGEATGTTLRYGEAAGTIAFAGSGTGTATRFATAAGTVEFSGTGTGAVTRVGEGSGSIVLTGTATGARTAVGEGAGTVALTGTATGLRTAVGEGAGTVTFSATTTGTPTRFATAAGTVEFSGTATGSGTAGTIYGEGAGTVTFSGTATGTPTHLASAAGTVAFDGSATGTPVRLGEGTGTVTFAGSATGAKTVYGSASGTVTFTATATGNRTAFASGSGTVTFTATVTGTPTRFASGSGTIVFTGTATSTQQLVRPISTITVGGWDTAPTAGQLLYVYTSDESETTYIFDSTA